MRGRKRHRKKIRKRLRPEIVRQFAESAQWMLRQKFLNVAAMIAPTTEAYESLVRGYDK